MKAEVVPANAEHIGAIAARVRPADALELWLAYRQEPGTVMRWSLEQSAVAWSGLADGVPVCMFGVAPVIGAEGVGTPWMIGSVDVERYQMAFLRRCKGRVTEMLQVFPVLENYVHKDNRRALEWLAWLGFDIEPLPVAMGPFGAAFCYFSMRR